MRLFDFKTQTLLFITVCVVLTTAAVSPCMADEAGQKRAGFATEIHFGTTKPFLAFADDDLYDMNSVQGGLFLGGKLDRVIFGLGLEYARMHFQGDEGGEDSELSTSHFLIVPGVRIALLRSDDQKVELFAHLDLGFGTTVVKGEGRYSDAEDHRDDQDIFLFKYLVGPGIRYWAHPQFSIGMTAGIQGDLLKQKDDTADEEYENTDMTFHIMSVVALLQCTAVF